MKDNRFTELIELVRQTVECEETGQDITAVSKTTAALNWVWKHKEWFTADEFEFVRRAVGRGGAEIEVLYRELDVKNSNARELLEFLATIGYHTFDKDNCDIAGNRLMKL